MATFPIVTVNASITQAAIPSNLQQQGALVSQGGTTKAPGTLTSVGNIGDVTTIIAPPLPILTLAWVLNVVTLTTVNPHGFTDGDVVPVLIAGASPTGYNGAFAGTVTGASTITYPLPANPGAETVPGTVQLGSALELLQMATTYFAGQGVLQVNVLELGEGTVGEGVAALSTFITEVDQTAEQQYAYLVPREWDNNPDYLALLPDYTAVDKLTYFYTTTTLANKLAYAGLKCVYAQVEAPAIGSTEFSSASAFGTALKASPGSSSRVPPMEYAPSYGTTAYPLRGNQTIFAGLANANVGWIGTGQQGGITTNILYQGKFSDGNLWNFWYSVDWAQVNFARDIANEVINGSASTINPLYYDQPGIDRLQNRAAKTATRGINSGLGTGQVLLTQLSQQDFLTAYNNGTFNGKIVINAEPFAVYTAENPADYGLGKYAGLTCIWVTKLGFLNIFFNLQATDLITV